MKLLQCITDSHYIIWQLYVQMLNFREYGYEKDAVILVNTIHPSDTLKKFASWTKAKVYYFPDTRESNNYFSSFRPNLIKQYLQVIEKPDVFFYHDQDIIFRRYVDLDQLGTGTDHYVAESASSYLSTAYLKSFTKYNHLEDMCAIVGIDPQKVAEFNEPGGAQYIIKGTDFHFWDKVENDCEAIYKKLRTDTIEDSRSQIHHIQIWTADMWAVLYNLLLTAPVHYHADIDFCWPWEKRENVKPIFHNAGIAAQNELLPKSNTRIYFNKSLYNNNVDPFNESHDYVLPEAVQNEYIAYFTKAKIAMQEKKYRVLGVFCTTNKINPNLLRSVLQHIKTAADNAEQCVVDVVTCSWQPINGNPFRGIITPVQNLGHLNYVLQIKQILTTQPSDIVVMLEHDVLYPDNYFDYIVSNWDKSRYGVWNLNYIGMNDTGFLKVRQRDAPMSMMAAARFYFDKVMNMKLEEALSKFNDRSGGSIFIEPNIADFRMLPFTNIKPCIHVNMNKRGEWGTGQLGLNHHFTNHCDVCYESESGGVVEHSDWGSHKELMPT